MRRLAGALVLTLGCGFPPAEPDGGPDASDDGGSDWHYPDAGTLPLGSPCRLGRDCATGRCAIDCAGDGLCVAEECGADDECTLPKGGRTACCNAEGACELVDDDACGYRDGDLGAPCSSRGDSDCAEGLLCLATCQAGAFCAMPCAAEGECEAIDPVFACLPSPRGDACQPHPDRVNGCARETDCTREETCRLRTSWDGESIVGICGAGWGREPPGGGCREDGDCGLPICWIEPGQVGTCAGVCTEDADCTCDAIGFGCDRDQVCVPILISAGEELSQYVDLCYEATHCAADTSCAAESACEVLPFDEELHALCKSRTPFPLGREEGLACVVDSRCLSGRCIDGVCFDPLVAGEPCDCDVDVDGSECADRCVSRVCLNGTCTTACGEDAGCQAIDPGWSCLATPWSLDPDDPKSPMVDVALCRAP